METFDEVLRESPDQCYHQPSFIAPENSFFYQFSERPQENWWESYESEEKSSSNMNVEEDEDVLERLMTQVNAKGHKMIKKLVSKVENNVPFEENFREMWHHLQGKPAASRLLGKVARKVGREREGGFVRRERDLDVDVLQGELKNERFKVKTMNIIGSGVVKEEGRQ